MDMILMHLHFFYYFKKARWHIYKEDYSAFIFRYPQGCWRVFNFDLFGQLTCHSKSTYFAKWRLFISYLIDNYWLLFVALKFHFGACLWNEINGPFLDFYKNLLLTPEYFSSLSSFRLANIYILLLKNLFLYFQYYVEFMMLFDFFFCLHEFKNNFFIKTIWHVYNMNKRRISKNLLKIK